MSERPTNLGSLRLEVAVNLARGVRSLTLSPRGMSGQRVGERGGQKTKRLLSPTLSSPPRRAKRESPLSVASSHTLLRRCAWLIVLASALLGGWLPAEAGEVSATLLGPTAPVVSGTEIRTTLNILNPSAASVDWKFPTEINARLHFGARTTAVQLRLASTATSIAIAPQSFARADYKFTPPADCEGDTLLETEECPGSAAILKIQPAQISATQPSATKPTAPFVSSVPEDLPRSKTADFDPIDYFKRHLFPHEPFYFVAGPESPNAKFQLSFKYQLVDDRSGLANHVGCATNLFFAFTQTSLWDWNKESAPFEDSSYKPELMFQFNRLAHAGDDDWFHLDLQTGVMHESNGRDGANSRSLNLAFLRPKLVLGRDDDWQFTLASRLWFYVGDLVDNPDLARYRGHADLRATFGTPWGVELAAFGRMGDDFDRGSLQLDLTVPLRRFKWAGFTWYLQAQYFTGYGESLLHYNERSEAWRIGFALYR